MLGHDFGAPLIVSPWAPGAWFDEYFNRTRGQYRQQSETKQPAELTHPGIAFPSAPLAGGANRQPNFIAGSRSVNGLQHKFQIECNLQFADDDGGRGTFMQSNEIAAAYFALHLEAKAFEETLHR